MSGDGPEDVGFLNRKTAEIVFVPDGKSTQERLAAWLGDRVATEMMQNLTMVEVKPDEWVEIPKYQRLPEYHEFWCPVRTDRHEPRYMRVCDCGTARTLDQESTDVDEFIRDFLLENGIDAGWR